MDIELGGSSLSFEPTAHVSPVARGKSPSKLVTWPPSNISEPKTAHNHGAEREQ